MSLANLSREAEPISAFTDGILEPIEGVVAFAVSAGPSLAANTLKRMFVDSIGQSSAGGWTVGDGDQTITGGVIPANMGFHVHGMACWVHHSDFTVPTEAALLALGSNVQVSMLYAGIEHRLGLLANFLGPLGAPTGLNNRGFERRFGWPWMREERPAVLRQQQQFELRFRTIAALTAGVAASTTYAIRCVMLARRIAANDAAAKQ